MGAYLNQLEKGARCQKWELVVSVGSRNKRLYKTRRFTGGKREAQKALTAFEAEVQNLALSSISFLDFANKWNESRYKTGAIRTNTYKKYLWHIHVIAPLLPEAISKITPSDITEAYITLRDPQREGGKPWSGTSLRTMHNSLSAIFEAAVNEKVIATSPLASVNPPQKDTAQKHALSNSEVMQLLASLSMKDNRHFAIALMLSLGMRPGECCAIEWRDVQPGVLNIRREVTKTEAGVRSLPLDLDTELLVKQRRAILQVELARAGAKLGPTDKVCCGFDGRPLDYDALRRWWQRNRAKFGLEGWTLHELRHTYLTNLAQANVHPSIMQKLAGHATAAVTTAIYTHINCDDMRQAQETLAHVRKAAS